MFLRCGTPLDIKIKYPTPFTSANGRLVRPLILLSAYTVFVFVPMSLPESRLYRILF